MALETRREERRLRGIPVSPGVSRARVCLFNEGRHADLPVFQVAGADVAREDARARNALARAAAQLQALRADVAARLGEAEAAIIEAQRAILTDPALEAGVFRAIGEQRLNAEGAVAEVLDAFEERLARVDDDYIRDRATDIGEVKRRLLDILGNLNPSLQCAGQPHCQKGRDRIIVAQELTPTLALALDTDRVLGFVTERGGKTSHASILARAFGIPAVTGVKGIHGSLGCGTELIVDGTRGEVIVWPSDATRAAYPQAMLRRAPPPAPTAPVPGLRVLANLTTAEDAAEALREQAEGVGLYRTEFEFFNAGRLLTEDEQAERYSAVVRAMAGRPVTIRLLDVGGDKEAPCFNIPPEQNPYLGFRGSRLLLARRDLLAAQARALARAAREGPVQVLYPMIVGLDQFRALRQAVIEAIGDRPHGALAHGPMLEVPSACLQARELLAEADFASIGTNDLIQYLFAVDRNNDLVAADFTPDRPPFWSLIERMAAAAADLGKPLSVCGELAGDPAYTERLMRAGVRIVSVSPSLIARVRDAARAAAPRQGAPGPGV